MNFLVCVCVLWRSYGIDINDVGTYTGSFEKGFRKGRGRWDLNDGTTISKVSPLRLLLLLLLRLLRL